MLKIKTEGFKELDKLLQTLPKNVENRVLQKSVTKSLRAVLPEIKAAAPRHTGERSPASKEFGTSKKNMKVKKFRRTRKGQKASRITTGNAFWVYIYEFGSRYQPARPWFFPAFRAAVPKILRTLGDEIGKGIEEEAKKLARGGK